jgi:hypothetical protein
MVRVFVEELAYAIDSFLKRGRISSGQLGKNTEVIVGAPPPGKVGAQRGEFAPCLERAPAPRLTTLAIRSKEITIRPNG